MSTSENSRKKKKTSFSHSKILGLLVCPITGSPLFLDEEKKELVSKKAKLSYPIRNGVAIILPSEARSLDEDNPLPYDFLFDKVH